jgi:UDP-N-acetylglucosamine--N-acetylmuramyl-(pentapeptide) pyrophosphoryl-undecaprenol N-acetylglucosamine transferase
MKKKSIIIATGGTGGHINPAIATAECFIKNDYDVLVVGNDKIEKYLVGKNIKYKIVSCGSSLTSFKSVANIIKGMFQSFRIIINFKPLAVIGFGSYTTLPMLLVSKFKKITIFLHEGNSFVGKINRLFLDNAKYIFTSFQELYGINIKYTSKVQFTGVPVRKEIKKLSDNAFKYPKDDEKFKILITGGSGGASFFSNDFLKVFEYLNANLRKKIKVFHQVKLKEELDTVRSLYEKLNIESEVLQFFDDFPQKVVESHLVICRSGIGTASELSAIGRPTVFVPSPNVANDHQLYNANFFKRNGACIVIEEKYFVANDFTRKLEELINSEDILIDMSKKIKGIAIFDAEDKIVKIVGDELVL